MGQQIFIPHSSGGGGGATPDSVFLAGLYQSGAAYVDYGLETGADIFYSASDFSAVLVFRIVRENVDALVYPLLEITDSDGSEVLFFIDADSKIAVSCNGTIITPDTCELPLGRVFVVTFTRAADGSASLYLNGLYMRTETTVISAVVPPVSILFGGNGDWSENFAEYLGFAYIGSLELNADQVADIYMATQDAGRLVVPPAIVSEESFVVYNSDTGLTNIALWVPEFNTISAPDLPAIPNGLATGTLLPAPYYPAHSGWADIPLP